MSMRSILALLAGVALCSSAVMAQPSYRQQPFELPAQAASVVVTDLNGDGLRELIVVLDRVLRAYVQSSAGFDFADGYVDLPLEANAVGWDLSQGYGPSTAIITLDNGRDMRAWRLQDGAFVASDIASDLPGFLGKGIQRLHFSRDIDGDGLEDLVIPGAGQLHIYIRESGNEFQAPLSIRSETRTRTALNINRLNSSAGQAITIPRLELRDVNGDGANDLVSRTDERLDVFLAHPGGSNYFPSSPSFTLDIAAIEAGLGEFDVDNLDFSNLTGVLALTHEELLEDMNNDGIEDLLLREGGKVSLFTGRRDGMDFEQPTQVLRSGGNVLTTFLYDENEDGLKDLWLWRVEPISVGDLFVWLALSGSIGIEAFVYPNDGERFSRRPVRRIRIDLRFPSVLRLANVYEDINSQAEAINSSDIIPVTPASLSGGAERVDLMALVDNQVRLFTDAITPEPENEEFLGALGYSRQRDDYTINIRDLIDQVSVRANPLLAGVENQEPAASIALDAEVRRGDIFATRLDADEVDDAIVFTDFDPVLIRGLLLLSN